MKTLILSAIMSLLLISSTFSPSLADKKARKERREIQKAASTFSTTMFVGTGGKLTLLVFKYGVPKRTTISVRDKAGEIVYREFVESRFDKFGRVMALDQLEPGIYSVEVASNGITDKKLVTISEKVTERSLAVR